MRVENKTFDEERALYGLESIEAVGCRFEGPADGESAFKECGDVAAVDCYLDLRYPFWHDGSVVIKNSELTSNCRAALWYSADIEITGSILHGIKALRECKNAIIAESDIISPEFGWSTDGIRFTDTSASGEYFLMRARNITARRLDFKGKYSFQYVENADIKNCKLDTKDAFWHSKNVTVENSVVIGEYLGWYSKNLTFKNCTIIGTQPLCYCKNLKLVDCVMQNTDLAFERSDVFATLRHSIVSIKNPYRGIIKAPSVGEIIRDDARAKAKIILDPSLQRKE